MTLNDYKAYRAIWKPVWELKKWREQVKRNRQAWAIKGFRKMAHEIPFDDMASEVWYMHQEEKRQMFHGTMLVGAILLAALMLLIFGCQQSAHAEIAEQNAIKCVIGEAENQGFIGMLALSHALRNRGFLKGCYGLNSARVQRHLYSQRVYNQAKLAWEQSAIDYDMTRHATGWGNAEDLKAFARCKWWRNCRITFMYRDHWFYRRAV